MKGKFPEARAKVKEIVKLLQNEHFCSKYPFIDPMTGIIGLSVLKDI